MGASSIHFIDKVVHLYKKNLFSMEDVVVPSVLDLKNVKMGEYYRFYSSIVYAYWFILLCVSTKRCAHVHAQTCFVMNY